MKKTIDVIIPAYNAEKFIERTMRSVVLQTLPPEKIIVVDDGSTDGTVNVIKEFAKTSNIQIQLNLQENRGPNAARNEGLRHSTSEFVAFLDADDVWTNDKLERQIEVFEKTEFEKLGLVYCGYGLINEAGEKINRKVARPVLKGEIFEKILESNLISGSCSSVLIKKECVNAVGWFDENLSGSEDWDMWLRISQEWRFDFSQNSMVFITNRNKSNNKDFEKMLANRIKFLNKWIDEIGKSGELITLHRNKLIMLSIRCKIGNRAFNISENIDENSSDSVKTVLFGNNKLKIIRFIPSAVLNYFIERFF